MCHGMISIAILKGRTSNEAHAGHPMATATENNIVFPLPYPRDLYITGAERGRPNPARDLSVPTAASADAEWIE